jgi:hypothetical protein
MKRNEYQKKSQTKTPVMGILTQEPEPETKPAAPKKKKG